MTTPIFDFINEYQKKNPVRLHMPGHKGVNTKLGIEKFDITEIEGADELFAAEGIIAESEANASRIFGSHTFYSTEGSSLAIRAMLFLFVKWCRKEGREARILAARNVHKTFINTVSLLDIKTEWINRSPQDSFEECKVTADILRNQLEAMEQKPAAVYITSPDYLGNVTDIGGIAKVCHENDIFLLVDNAHGAYLKFMNPSMHPIDLGADMCADSAHKTLPVLTGGAYLHISYDADEIFARDAKLALEMFGSTSPSYLILASLDLANEYMETLSERLKVFESRVLTVRNALEDMGYVLKGDELLKITVDTSENANGRRIAEILMREDVYPEYIDDNHIVFMLSLQNNGHDLGTLIKAMSLAIKKKSEQNKIETRIALNLVPEAVMSPNEAILTDYEILPAEECAGRILAAATVSCPPAVPVFMMGERIGTDEYTRTEILGKLLKGQKLKVVREDK